MNIRVLAAVPAVALLLTTPASGQQLREPCSIIMEAAFSDGHFSYVKPANFERVPAAVLPYANQSRESSSATVMTIPLTSTDYRAVFDKPVTAAKQREIDEARALFGSATPSMTTEVSTRADFRRFVKRQHATYVLIAGHNVDGVLQMRSEKVDLPLLAEDCARAAKVCIFISCKSDDYVSDGSIGIVRDLTLSEGVYLTNELTKWLQSNHSRVSVIEVANHVRHLQSRAFLKYHVSYFALAACKTAGTIAVAFLLVEGLECLTDKQHCPAGTKH